MRKLILTVVMAGLILSVPVWAQFGGFGMGKAIDPANYLAAPDVQKELKLTDDQKKAVTEATKERDDALKTAREEKDFEAMGKAMEGYTKALTKVKESLNTDQKKRLGEIELQTAITSNQPNVFKRADLQKALALTDKQKDMIKDSLTELEKDVKELQEDAKGDFSRFREVNEKIQGMNKDAFAKITKTLTDDQKKAWKDAQGEKFEGKVFAGFGKGFGKKGKDK